MTITITTKNPKVNGTFTVVQQVGNCYYYIANGKPYVASWDGKRGNISRTMSNPMSVPKRTDLVKCEIKK